MIRIDFETPVVDGTVADVTDVEEINLEEFEYHPVGSMIYNQDLNQWNDTGFPGDVADPDPFMCATMMVEYRKMLAKRLDQ